MTSGCSAFLFDASVALSAVVCVMLDMPLELRLDAPLELELIVDVVCNDVKVVCDCIGTDVAVVVAAVAVAVVDAAVFNKGPLL